MRNRVEFERRLAELVETAVSNGVDPRGGWAIRDGYGPPRYDPHITEVDTD